MLRKLPAVATVGLLALPTTVSAQLELPRPSPAAEIKQRVGLTDVTVKYSSPGVKGRKIWGKLVPYGELWRTGANKSTSVTFSQDVTFGGKAVKAGSYALYTLPTKKGWSVVLHGETEASGPGQDYDKSKEVARVRAETVRIPQRERLAFIFSNTTDDATRLDLEWERLRVSVPISVDTKTQALAAIDRDLGRTWVQYARAAEYLLENGGDLEKALAHVDSSMSLRKHWWNHWVKAQVLAKLGRTSDALTAALSADKLGADNQGYQNNFKEEVQKSIAAWKKANKS